MPLFQFQFTTFRFALFLSFNLCFTLFTFFTLFPFLIELKMKLIHRTLLFLCLLSAVSHIYGQNSRRIPGQILASLLPGATPEPVIERFEAEWPDIDLRLKRKVATFLNIWLLETGTDEFSERIALEWLRRQPDVRMAQYNRLLEERSNPPDLTPNDPFFSQQWQHVNTGSGSGTANADFDSDLAWNITTGGLTPLGDTIVVAIIDGGIEHTHEDLTGNMWRNYQEIPGDSIDNDGNGYTDDFLGWNVYAQTDNITGLATGHGTPVSALAGAKGNNGKGVAGINWDVKMMFVAGNSQESAILAAYDYVINARKRYNDSNGQQGAFVVSVNCSWGISLGQPSDYPLWCAAFDSLGAEGILSIAATDNMPSNVDVAGDIPTACPSDYLVTVTSLTNADLKASNAAWGALSIDLGAYGKDVYTAGINNSYGTYTGTSFAAPQVSGAIGLLYAAPCSNLSAMARADPAMAAQWAKDLLLESTTPNADLLGKTVTGGRLNLFNLLQNYQDQCANCLAPFGVQATGVDAQQATIRWSQIAAVQSVNLRWRKSGDPIWTLVPMAPNPFLLTGLEACTMYEISLRANCGGVSLSDWTIPFVFQTDGCCAPPATVDASGITATSVTLTWSNLTAATGYRLRIQPKGGAWKEYLSGINTLILNDLTPCTEYEVSVQTLCGQQEALFSDIHTFRTAGCGACTDKIYCAAKGKSANDEWIASVEIGPWSRSSGGLTGYENYTGAGMDSMLTLWSETNVPIALTPGFSGLPYKEYFRVYIDYNGDGYFSDPAELAFDPGFASEAQVSGELVVPPATGGAPSLARMRILMKYKGPQDAPPTPCETFEFGQVEDYCVLLMNMTISANEPGRQAPLRVYPQPANDWFFIDLPGRPHEQVNITILDATGRAFFQDFNTSAFPLRINTSGWPSGMYVVRLENDKEIFQQKVLKIR